MIKIGIWLLNVLFIEKGWVDFWEGFISGIFASLNKGVFRNQSCERDL